jgi:DNA-binding NtrC family response regulator
VSDRTQTVLVVDADPATADVARSALPLGRYRVLVAPDARRALVTLHAERVDVLVCELVLPDDDGVRLLGEVRRRHPSVVRVALTAIEEFGAAVAAINQAEVFRLLRKPANATALRAAVDEALQRADAAQEVRRAYEAAERRRIALLDLEAAHPGISLVPSTSDGYFVPRQRLRAFSERLRGTEIGRLLEEAIAARG